MKLKALKIKFESFTDFQKVAEKALKGAISERKKTIQKKDTIIFDSVESYQKFMSDQKYAILAMIAKYEPQSIYQLAKSLNRPPQNVARDCDLLEAHGFIVQKGTGDRRKAKAPELAFDYNIIIVYMPQVTYKIEFGEVA